ncbi:MAG: glycosyltransferase family 9 protein [Flavobacteriales bacterium]|nr:glycosyltransferase family 9 protein [Flavobacteriales bacterium]
MREPEHIILSRPDGIGDVMLTLPMAGVLRARWPQVRITFLGRIYTAPVLRHCAHLEQVVTLEELRDADPVATFEHLGADAIVHVFPQREVARWASRARIPMRIGTSHRWWHWTTCTHRVDFSRRRSELHEARLNLELLRPLGFTDPPDVGALSALSGFMPPAPGAAVRAMLKPGRSTLVLHPRSKGSAVEWGLDRFSELIHRLDPETWHVVVTGTKAESESYREALPLHLSHVTDAGGRLDLDQLIGLIAASDALVAASTGPLHIAAACGIRAIGLYAPQHPIHPGRWAPLGKHARALVAEEAPNGDDPAAWIRAIGVDQVLSALETPSSEAGSRTGEKTSSA